MGYYNQKLFEKIIELLHKHEIPTTPYITVARKRVNEGLNAVMEVEVSYVDYATNFKEFDLVFVEVSGIFFDMKKLNDLAVARALVLDSRPKTSGFHFFVLSDGYLKQLHTETAEAQKPSQMKFGDEWASVIMASGQRQYEELHERLANHDSFWELLRSVTVDKPVPNRSAFFGYTDENQVGTRFLWQYSPHIVVDVLRKEFSIHAEQNNNDHSWVLRPLHNK